MTDSTTASALYAEAITARTLRAAKSGALASVEDVVHHVRKATIARVVFAAVMALLSSVVLPLAYAAIWFAFIAL